MNEKRNKVQQNEDERTNGQKQQKNEDERTNERKKVMIRMVNKVSERTTK